MRAFIFFKVEVNDRAFHVVRSGIGQPVYAIYTSEMTYFLKFNVFNNFEIIKSVIG